MTFNRSIRRIAGAVFASCCVLALVASYPAIAQDLSTGSLNVTVTDPMGAAVNGAKLELRDIGTNEAHNVDTQGTGTAVIPFLTPAHYALTVTKEGFSTKVYPAVTIQTNQVTDIKVTLELGVATQSVSVTGESSPLLDSSQNTLSTTLDLKQVQELPLENRDAFDLAFYVAGAAGNNFNNLPGGAVNASSNGFSTINDRSKSGGFSQEAPVIQNRLEDVEEVTIQTSELDASKGGTATMDIAFTTRRGTNRFHGQFYDDFRNDAMNANSWVSNYVGQPRQKLIINDFGGSIGGPIIKDKLFFFASLANYRSPGKVLVQSVVPTAAAAAGIYSYFPGNSSTPQTLNVLQAGASGGCSTCYGTINPVIATDLANIQSTYSLSGVTLSPVDINHNEVNFYNKEYTVERFPTVRLDYNLTPNFRLTGSANESNYYYQNDGAPPFPGPDFSNQIGNYLSRNYQVVTGFDWNIRPDFVNAFRAGYLYDFGMGNPDKPAAPTPDLMEQGDLSWGFGLNSGVNNFNAIQGAGFYYPVISFKDDSTWERGRHTISFGYEFATELDHYYNGQFVPYVDVNGLGPNDPVTNALAAPLPADAPASAVGDVQGLYATLTGRLNTYSLGQFVNPNTKQFSPGISFNLHEKLTQSALFVEDAWRVKPTLTVNAGLRWDFTGASKDETGFYTHPTIPNFWGPSGVGNLFQPGVLTGVQNPVEGPSSEAYSPTYFHPEPNIGIAWNPQGDGDSLLGRLFGPGKTVIRASYTFKNYTEGAQNFWSYGSNGGYNFNTFLTAFPTAPVASVTPGPGFYNSGSVNLGGTLPALGSTAPNPFQSVIPESFLTFSGGFSTIDPNIKQPYVESWAVGIQRELSSNNVLEVRYVGNVAKDQWLGINVNEVNIFENGFLNDFRAAQANLAASGGTTFQGAHPTPILSQAFATTGASNFTNAQYITWLNQGQAGAFANQLAGSSSFLCSLVGASNFSPCGIQGVPGTGNYPINLFQANPFAAGNGISELTNAGFSNYNALQIDFRQRLNHGMQFNVNYTLSHSLGTSVQGSTAPGFYGGSGNSGAPGYGSGATGSNNSAPGFYTLRNRHLNYFPSSFDIPNVLHASGTYDLPFGRSRLLFNQNPIANAIIGGWTLGTIVSWQSGDPHLFTGGTSTFNTSDSGITLTGVTPSQLQKQIHIRPSNGQPWVNLFAPKYYSSQGQANTALISPNFSAGQFGNLMWLHDPKWFNTDLALTKVIPIYKEMNFSLQGEFLNVFNHVAWSGMDSGAQDTTFGTTAATANTPRNIEIRGNFRF
jgi:hypothetical protein